MSETFFTADEHWFHGNIIDLSHRPFGSVEEMNEALIEGWNGRVTRRDTVYFLGDLSFGSVEMTLPLVRRLNGTIHAVEGNHDDTMRRLHRQHPGLFASCSPYKEIRVNGQKIILSHFPFAEWNLVHRGSWHLHGQQHGNGEVTTIPRLDVGVDCTSYQPIHFDEVSAIMAERVWVPISHH